MTFANVRVVTMRFEVRGVDTYELRTELFRERAYYPLASFHTQADAIAFAEEQAKTLARSDPNLCDRIEVLDRETKDVVWDKRRPDG